MEHFNNKYDFEDFLKNGIEDFVMIPQRKVWYSIYNHLHPQKKWPSIAASLVILISILHVGITNNKTINKERLVTQQNFTNSSTPIVTKQAYNNLIAKLTLTPSPNEVNLVNLEASKNYKLATNFNEAEHTFYTKKTIQKNGKLKINVSKENEFEVNNSIANNDEINSNIKFNNAIEANTESIAELIKANTSIASIDIKEKIIAQPENKNTTNQQASIQLPTHQSNKSINYYITPSFGYRNISKKTEANKVIANAMAASNNNSNLDEFKNDEKAVNFEIGAVLEKKVFKKSIFKIGAQLNYTNYITRASYLKHPSQNVIALSTSQNYVPMDFDATPGNITLNKTTLQVSVPIGVDTKLAGNEKIAWHAGASFQPTYVFGGNAYLLSADSKNYVNEKSLLRRLNFNIAAETFVSLKTAKDIILHVGPQVRYQILSTYKNTYNYSEKLFNIGAKIGVSTNF